MAASSGLFLATIYNQSQLAERKHVARYWSINTAATAVPLSRQPSPLVITTKLAAAIFGVPLFGGGALPAQYYPCAEDCNASGYTRSHKTTHIYILVMGRHSDVLVSVSILKIWHRHISYIHHTDTIIYIRFTVMCYWSFANSTAL